MTGPESIFGIKIATIIAGFIGAVISIVVDYRSHDFLTAIGSLIAGVFIAAIATNITIEYFSLSEVWGNGIAGFLGITGRNLIVFFIRASRDPANTISIILKGWRK